MQVHRDIARTLAIGVLIAIPLLVGGWSLLASGMRDGSPLIASTGLICVIAGALLVVPPFAAFAGEMVGSIIYGSRMALREPSYSTAIAKRRKQLYADAMEEYEKIVAEFPREMNAYVDMIEIAVVHLGDIGRAESICRRALENLTSDQDRIFLLKRYCAIKTKYAASQVNLSVGTAPK